MSKLAAWSIFLAYAVAPVVAQPAAPAGGIIAARPEDGLVSSSQYTNQFFGFTLPLPQGIKFEVLPRLPAGAGHFLAGFKYLNTGSGVALTVPKLTVLTLMANESSHPLDEIKAMVVEGHEKDLKRMQIGGREFQKATSRQKTKTGELEGVTYFTIVDRYILRFMIISFDRGLTDKLQRSIESVTFFDPQKAREEAELSNRSFFAELDPGTVSEGTYSTQTLRFSLPVPEGWRVVDPTEQEKILETGHQAAYGGAPGARRDHQLIEQCSRRLLWITKNPPGEPSPAIVIMAFNPGCWPDPRLIQPTPDQDTMKEIGRVFFSSLGSIPAADHAAYSTKSYTIQGHRMNEVSGRIAVKLPEHAPVEQHASVLMTQIDKYLILWILLSYDEAGFEELRDKARPRFF